MGSFGRGRGCLDSGAFGICFILPAQLAGPQVSSEHTARIFIIEMTSRDFIPPVSGLTGCRPKEKSDGPLTQTKIAA